MKVSQVELEADVELLVTVEDETLQLNSRVAKAFDNNVLIYPIQNEGKNVGFDKSRVDFLYKTDGHIYKWDKVDISLVKVKDDIYHMISVSNTEGTPYNRRGAFRIFVGEYMKAQIKPIGASVREEEVMLKDVSESGMGFITEYELDENKIVLLHLDDEDFKFELFGKIVRHEFNDQLGKYVYGCQFTAGHKNISKYVMKKQALKRRMDRKKPITEKVNSQGNEASKNVQSQRSNKA